MEILEPLFIPHGSTKCAAIMETGSISKSETELSQYLSNSTPRYMFKRIENRNSKRYSDTNANTAALFTTVRRGKQPMYPSKCRYYT